jgi:hypothetical protein
LKPIRRAEIGPIRAEIRDGAVHRGARREAEALQGSFDVAIDGFDPRTAKGADILHGLSLDTDLRATCPVLGDLPFWDGAEVAGSAEIPRLALHVRGGVVQEPTQAEVHARGVSVARGGHRVAGDVDLEGEVTGDRLAFHSELHRVEVGRAKGETRILRAPRLTVTGDSAALDVTQPLGDLHAALDLPAGEIPDVRALFTYLPKDAPIGIEGGRATASARLEGWLREGRATGSAQLRAEELDLRVAKVRVRGATTAEASVGSIRWRDQKLEKAKLSMRISKGTLSSASEPRESLVELNALNLETRAPYVDLKDPLRAFSARIVIPDGTIVSQTLLHAYLPKGSEMRIVSTHARFSLECDAAIAEHLARGTLAARSKRFGIKYRDLDLIGDIDVRGQVHDWRWESGDLALDEATIDVSQIGVTAGGKPGLSAERIAVNARSPRLDLSRPTFRGADLHLKVAEAQVQDARALQAFVPDTSLLFIESGTGRVSADVAIESSKRSARGEVIVDLRDARVKARSMHLGGDFRIVGHVRGFGPDPGALDVSGSGVTMRNVEVLGTEGKASEWYGDLLLRQATLRIDPDPELDTYMDLDARDAKPLVAILLQSGLPNILGNMADVAALSISTRLTAAPKVLALRDVDVRGGDLSVRGSYATRDEHKYGAFIVTKGILSVGMRLGDDGAHVRFFGLEGWLEKETENTKRLMKGKEGGE